jgi:hypothetical protein
MIRQPVRRNPSKRPTTIGASIPAPVGGWNAIDPLAAMPVKDAVILDNWIPRASYVELRKGSRTWRGGAPAAVESLLVYRGLASGEDEMFACADLGIYDATNFSLTIGSVQFAITEPRIQYVNFSNDGGAWLLCCNGTDVPFKYDGSAWANLAITGSSGSITLDDNDLIDVMTHKRRNFWIEKESLRVWFLDVLAIQGAAQLLDLGSVFQMGGQLQCMGTWSLDGGQGQDDVAVFMTNQGEVAIYQGTDPSDSDNWALVGVFSIGIPLGRRSMFKYGGDLNILTTNGVLPLSQALNRDRAQDQDVAITAKIQNAFSVAAQSYRDNFGWEGLTYQRGTLAIYNVPTAELTTSEQFVQNIQTGAWCKFTGINALCWAIKDDLIYYGGPAAVYQWDIGVTDAGVDLVADLKTAFNYFGDRGSQKRFTLLRPTLNATANVLPAIEVLTDYQEREPTAVPTTIIDRSTTLRIRDNWTGATGVGYCGSVRMQVRLQQDPNLLSVVVVSPGGDTVIIEPAGDELATDSGEPADAQIQLLAMNLQYQRGSAL